MQEPHRIILEMMPAAKLWFLDGKNPEGKTVSNPNMGYGLQNMVHAGADFPDISSNAFAGKIWEIAPAILN